MKFGLSYKTANVVYNPTHPRNRPTLMAGALLVKITKTYIMKTMTLKELKEALVVLQDAVKGKTKPLTNELARGFAAEIIEVKKLIAKKSSITPTDCYSSDCCFNYNSRLCNINCDTYAKEEAQRELTPTTPAPTKKQLKARKSFKYQCKRASACRWNNKIESCLNAVCNKAGCDIQWRIETARKEMH